ncbi:hypothetical protein A2334_00210 [Candidatus Roizmanbacteria bacterium RIFOXYB2_FULL_38_10]|uniref:HXXEE domain-containing protein n=1 Tax=Candidatus Roizmanbacteria bacterium RIFOXYD1_FULL_38_12 TaxID=1802093 RepID=A0A1F7L281_9BACT|nr:MAG: hypothetical protein A3K47_05755 [Candidatus Roizmanbacteria bacterium RIFOXYA2_FULL_38_14]OGK64247.1 MAG: hypothetical protein A3K27_05755 [Candidatus Roizmanbacteria bacterium RIFOXYA1_FULL_37_12]OGK66093.1 MAG: hypothetical protein A3K38_05755 [Candidatus Roizmanbacteria bacterium RIFOXYB1_FULL_40_23]OGK67658.1 MAG: hypothetical protein A2334_00210 [Candidatus Roizmanbacteria bacterium RIFOXYB2_FULL_38_10]OGK70498.1 MAG: hypothetical protein A3K21_05760 [Candidatus Roizmanbacteria ba
MGLVERYYTYFVIIYLFHSQEEIYTHFEKVWPLWKMSRRFFITMEILLSTLLISAIFITNYPYRIGLMSIFNLVMFANGIWHITGAILAKRYIPGLVSSPFAVILFLIYYFQLLTQ